MGWVLVFKNQFQIMLHFFANQTIHFPFPFIQIILEHFPFLFLKSDNGEDFIE